VNQKRRQVQHAINLAGVVLSVSEVMFKVISAVLQDVVIFVLYLPTGAAALRKQLNILGGDLESMMDKGTGDDKEDKR
jgi:uncharacterized membrane protein YdfJ with MMPL/SSD domain